jgi:hypothetical protein
VQNSFVTQSVLVLLVAAFVVFRFAVRELKPRVIKGGASLWARPVIMVVLGAWLVWTTVTVDPAGTDQLVGALAAGAILGAITGALIVRYTTFSPATVPNAVVASGSRVTFAIWVAAFVVRFLARFVVPHGADPRAQLPMNSGTVALVAVAFVVIAIAFQRAIHRYGGGSGGAVAVVTP